MSVAEMSEPADHPAASATPLRSRAARWQAEQRRNSCKIGRAMRFRAQAVSPEIESMRVYRASPEIESTPVFPVNWGIEWTRVYRVNPETVWIVAGRGSQASVDPDVLVTTYKIFQAELPTEASGKIGAK